MTDLRPTLLLCIRSIDDVIDDVGELGVNDEWSGGGSQTPGQQRLEVVG